jgi:hypothetical protein
MTQEGEQKWWSAGDVLSLLPYMLPLSLKSSVAYIEFKWQARKAKKIFVNELVGNGFEREAAAELAQIFISPSNLLGTILRRK